MLNISPLLPLVPQLFGFRMQRPSHAFFNRVQNQNHFIMTNSTKKSRSLGSLTRARLTFCAWLLLVCSAYAQTTVTGRVTSGEDSTPLPGVNILVKGTTEGTISDADGKFSITVPTNESILLFSFVGYQAQEVSVSGRTSFELFSAWITTTF